MPDEQPTEQPQTEDSPQQAPPELRAIDALIYTISMLAEQAWIQLGLRAQPGSNETKSNLSDARILIDAISALVPFTEGQMEPSHVRELKNLVETLRLNYIQRLP